MAPRAQSSPAAQAVLHLHGDRAEWLETSADGSKRLTRVPLLRRSAGEIAAALAQARGAGSSANVACLLAVGAGHLAQRTLTLPKLAPKEARAVFSRRAAQVLDCPIGDAAFAALSMSNDPSGERKEAERRWQLFAFKRSYALELSRALRGVGIEVGRATAARMAHLSYVESSAAESNSAHMVLDVEPEAIVVSLVHRGELVNQTVLEGDLERSPSLAVSVVQEAKSFESYWRRVSRGGALERATVIGLASERGRVFAGVLSGALAGLSVATVPDSDAGVDEARMAALEACRARGPLDVELTLPLAPPGKKRALTAAAVAGVALAGGLLAHTLVARRLAQLRDETETWKHSSRGLAELVESNRAIEHDRDALAAELARSRTLDRRAESFEHLLEDVVDSFRDHAGLRGLSLAPESDGGEVVVTGETVSDPVESLAAIEAVRLGLLRADRFAEVEIQTPGRLPDAPSRTAAESMVFSIRCKPRKS